LYIVEKIKKIDFYYNKIGLTIGNFEGFHKGHLQIIRTLVKESRKRGLFPAVITFKAHPLKVLQKREPEKLSAPCDKLLRLQNEGIDLLMYIDFSTKFANTEPGAFLSMLKSNLSPRLICLGKAFRFGRENQGNTDLIRTCSQKLGYELLAVDDVKWDGSAVSSTRIRNEVKKGNFTLAQTLLGHSYYVYVTLKQEDPLLLKPFISHWALPEDGSFYGTLENMLTKERKDTVLTVSGRAGCSLSETVSYRTDTASSTYTLQLPGFSDSPGLNGHAAVQDFQDMKVQRGELYKFYFKSAVTREK